MSVLITGATGFIGSRLALRCLADGRRVRGLGRGQSAAERETADLLAGRGAEVVIGSVTDPAAVARAHAGVEVVFHLAAAQHEANVPDARFHEVNVEGTRRVLEASASAGVRRFVHGSSIGVYGWIPGGHVRDDSPLAPDNVYGVTKLAGEEVVRSATPGPAWVIVRISEVYGPGDRRLIKMFRGVQRGRFPMIGSGANLHHLIHIDDLVDGLLSAASDPRAVGRTFVLAGPRPVSTREMVAAVARELGVRPGRVRLPLGPLMMVAHVMERALRPLGIQPPLHPRRMNFYRKSFAFDLAAAREALGFQPRIDLDEGLRTTARWYREQGFVS